MLNPCLVCGVIFDRRGATQQYCCPECRFAAKVSIADDGCWNWPTKDIGWYGSFGGTSAHRAAYEMFVGPIPEGLELDHLCENRACVNPDHLEPVTHHENCIRIYQSRDSLSVIV